MLFMLGSCLCYYGFHCYACMFVGYAWEGLKHIFLECFSFMSCLNFEDIFVSCFGITHPWIGKKWPCMREGL